MIYKRGKCKLDANGRCPKCGKRGSCGVYWYKFKFNGKTIRESTKQGNHKIARQMESAHGTVLAKGEVGFREKKRVPTLAEFLKSAFLPYAKTRHSAKPNTLRYYTDGAKGLSASSIANTPIDQTCDQHAQQYARQRGTLSASGINRGLRTLRRALNVAFQWGDLGKPIKVTLAAGERQRDRVLDEKEESDYLNACPQPWRDCATMILDEAFRPSEVFALRWEWLFFNEDGTGLIQITEGKSRAARRMLPMTPRVYSLLHARYEASGLSEGWVFPSTSKDGHYNGDTAKDHHKKALTDSGVTPFVPYTLRHTALTRLGEAAGGDIFVSGANRWSQHDLGNSALHSSTGRSNQSRIRNQGRGHKSGHNQKLEKSTQHKVLGHGKG